MNVNHKIMKYLGDTDKIKDLNWSKYILDCLVANKIYWDELPTRYFLGSLLFLMLLNVDRFLTKEVRAKREIPILKGWTTNMLSTHEKLEFFKGRIGSFGNSQPVAGYSSSKKPKMMNGVTDDALRLRLFPFSLRDRAKEWLRDEGSGSFDTLDKLVKAFLVKFLGQEKTAREVVEEAGASEKEVENSKVEDESKEAPPKPLASYVPKVPFPQSSTNTKKKTTPSVSNSRIPPFFKTKKTVLRANTLTRKTSSSTSCAKVKEKVNIDYYDIKFRDAAHRSKYETLFKRGVNSTRFCDIDALRALRIEEDVCWLFTNVGWGDFLMKRYPTYKRITLEFLSSLKAVTHSAEGCGEGSITFQLYNEEHTWTLTKFNEVLGLPNEGPRLTSKYWYADPIWRTLTDDREYDSNNSPGNHIRHPALRYVQRLLSCTVFGRYEGGKARKDELFMLDRMLHGQPINTGAFLIKQMRDLANKTTTSGAIVLGGLITPIALYLGHKERLVTEESIGGVDALDISACALMN
uniref:Arabidopsis retrotransposon Orf1 C-terminal domain-containing protein n=1 Tax=Chenopodium quinoa TaxID=63459 RepID=A0A803MRY6_CHEQI